MIGKGQYGCVYKALNLKEGKFVAIKQIDMEYLRGTNGDDPHLQLLSIMKNEIELVRKLEHPNVVKVLGYIEQEGMFYCILEFIENGSLQSVMKKFGEFPGKRRRFLFALGVHFILLQRRWCHSIFDKL
jgi:serine/threonine protein kinase